MATSLVNKPQTNAKRKQSAAGLPNGGRAVKRRASKACQCCRSRKVRCDVVESGVPCTNCRLDEVDCCVSDSKRRKKSMADGEITNHSPVSSFDESDEALPQFPAYDAGNDIPGWSAPPEDPIDQPLPSTNLEAELSRHVPHMLYQTQGHKITEDERKQRLSFLGSNRSALPTPLYTCGQAPSYFPVAPVHLAVTLPRYIRALPHRIQSDDIEYLQKKGALTIPDTALRNELLRSYAQYVHPYMPLLDLKDFLTPIERNDGNNVISLLLFHAVMFAGTAYIDMRFLQAQGFETRKAARKVFFQRARLLYDFDYEIDRITLVQALLLMTYWYETPDDQKDTWHWMGVSISLAQTIGLHRDPAKSSMDIQRQKLWKRIWWSCFMRDRLIALGMRRPTRIKHEDCDVPMLVEDDFETEGLPAELVRMLGGCPAVRDTAKRTTLARLCIETARLSLCISHVLSAQYSVLSHKFGSTVETTMMLVPKKAAAETCEVMQCNNELEQWYEQLDPSLRYFVPDTKERTNTNDGEVINLHRALLNMVHLTTSSALHRPQVIPSAPNLSFAADLQELSRKKVREAATEITEIARDLYTSDLVRYLPTTGVTVLLPAVIIHLLDIKSADPVVRNTSLRRFYQCMQVLQRLREMYASADFAFSFLEAAIRKANIEMPPESPSANTSASKTSRKNTFPATTALIANSSSYFPVEYSGQHTLTPPPDTTSISKPTFFLANSTVAPNEMNFFATASADEHSLNQNHIVSPPHSHSHSHEDLNIDLDNINSSGERVDQIMSKNDFEALINFDGGADLFAAEDGLGLENFGEGDWMAGLHEGAEGDEGEKIYPKTVNVNGAHMHDVDFDQVMEEEEEQQQQQQESRHKGIAIKLTGDLEQDLRMDDEHTIEVV